MTVLQLCGIALDIMTTVPTEHTVTVICKNGGSTAVEGIEYAGDHSYTVNRFSTITIDAVPHEDYYTGIITTSGAHNEKLTDSSITIYGICSDITVNIEFEKDNTAPDITTSSDCVIVRGGATLMTVETKSDTAQSYEWDMSEDGFRLGTATVNGAEIHVHGDTYTKDITVSVSYKKNINLLLWIIAATVCAAVASLLIFIVYRKKKRVKTLPESCNEHNENIPE